MEIERKFLVDTDRLPFRPEDYPCRHIEQGYLCTAPVVRIRRDNEEYFLTYKSKGLLAREEYNLPLTREAYEHLLPTYPQDYLDALFTDNPRYICNGLRPIQFQRIPFRKTY